MSDPKFKDFLSSASPGVKFKAFAALGAIPLTVLTSAFLIKGIWYYYSGHKPAAGTLAHREIAAEIPEFSITYEIKEMSVAFMNRPGTKTQYAQFTLVFDCPNEVCKKNMAVNRSKVLDHIFEVGADFYLEDLTGTNTAQGMTLFKAKVLEKLTKAFPHLAPKQVVFKDWIFG